MDRAAPIDGGAIGARPVEVVAASSEPPSKAAPSPDGYKGKVTAKTLR